MGTGHLLADLAVVVVVSALATWACHRLRQPVVLGYLVAGLVVGPHTPPFPLIRDQGSIHTLSELGVVFLMFTLGLEFRLGELRRVGAVAIVAASAEIAVMVGLGYLLGRAFGWPAMDSLFLGAVLSISSTTIIVKALDGLGLSREGFARLAFGILIVEDILAMALLALFSGLARTGGTGTWVALGRLSVFLVATLVAGLLAVPRLLAAAERRRSDELLLVAALAVCLGLAALAAKLGYSVALGAFLAGAMVAESGPAARVTRMVRPLRDLFGAIFFVAVGLQLDPAAASGQAGRIALVTAVVIAGKVAACAGGVLAGGGDPRAAARVGMSMAQIGEFSFIIAALGQSLGVAGPGLYTLAVSVSAVTTFTTPYMIRYSDALVGGLERRTPRLLWQVLDLYRGWLGRFGAGARDRQVRRLLRGVAARLAVFAALIAAAFLVADYLGGILAPRLPSGRIPRYSLSIALWLAAGMASLPVSLAALRKLKALAMMLAELGLTNIPGEGRRAALRDLAAGVAYAGGALLLIAYAVLLGRPLLPPYAGLAIFLLLALPTALAGRKGFNRLYFRAKDSLAGVLDPPPEPTEALGAGEDWLGEARLEVVEVDGLSPAAGKRLSELGAPGAAGIPGAKVVGLRREGVDIPFPGGDEEARPGDRLLLLGTPAQLAAAKDRAGEAGKVGNE